MNRSASQARRRTRAGSRPQFDLYARVGVAEYWIADPEEREVARYVLEHDGYREARPSPRRKQVLARHRIGVGRLDRGVALIGATDGRRIRGPME